MLVIRDSVGTPIAQRTVYADLAGNWMVSFLGVELADEPYTLEIHETPSSWNGLNGEGARVLGVTFNGAVLSPGALNAPSAAGQIMGSVLTPVSLEELVHQLTTH